MKTRGWFLLGLCLCVAIDLMPTPLGLTLHGKYVLGLMAMVILFFLTEAIPFGATAFIIVVYQVLLGIRTSAEAPKTFMHDSVFFIMGALMIATALIKYDIHKHLAAVMMKRFGRRIEHIVLGVVAIAALASAFMSEHAVSAMLLPIGVGLVSVNGGKARCPQMAKLLMLSIAYGCMIGAIATPSGGTRNVIMMSYLQEFAGVSVGYGQWMVYVFPLTLLLIPVVWVVLLRSFRPEMKRLQPLGKDPKWADVQRAAFTNHQKVVVGLFVLTIAAWILYGETLGLGQIAILSAVLYLVAGLVRWDDYAKINWQVVVFYGGIISLGEVLKDTGVAAWLAQQFSVFVGQTLDVTTGIPLIASTSILTMLLANSMGAGPTIAVIGPIVLKVGELGGVNPIAIGVSAAIATSFAFIVVAGSPASMIVYGSGFLQVRDFRKVGLVMSLISMVLLTIVIVAGYWQLLGV